MTSHLKASVAEITAFVLEGISENVHYNGGTWNWDADEAVQCYCYNIATGEQTEHLDRLTPMALAQATIRVRNIIRAKLDFPVGYQIFANDTFHGVYHGASANAAIVAYYHDAGYDEHAVHLFDDGSIGVHDDYRNILKPAEICAVANTVAKST
jgi:hypothetical protein